MRRYCCWSAGVIRIICSLSVFSESFAKATFGFSCTVLLELSEAFPFSGTLIKKRMWRHGQALRTSDPAVVERRINNQCPKTAVIKQPTSLGPSTISFENTSEYRCKKQTLVLSGAALAETLRFHSQFIVANKLNYKYLLTFLLTLYKKDAGNLARRELNGRQQGHFIYDSLNLFICKDDSIFSLTASNVLVS